MLARCYKMSMEEFMSAGLGWYVRTAQMEFKRPLGLGEHFVVRTWVEEFLKDGVRVNFEIDRKKNGQRCCDGYFLYTIVKLQTGRAEIIPDSIVAKYAI